MKKAIVVHDGFAVTRDLCEAHFNFLKDEGYEVEYIWDYQDQKDGTKIMMDTESNPPEALPLNQELLEKVPEAEILIVHFSIVNKQLIDAAKNLKILAVCRGGCDNVNVDYAREKGITVIHAASRSSNAVADATIAMAICEVKNFMRGFVNMHKGVRNPVYLNKGNNHDLNHMTVGLIGYGEIGSRVAKRFKACGSRVIVYDPFVPAEKIREKGEETASLEGLLTSADIVSMHLRLSDKTRNFLNRERIAMMKPTTYVVNTARAGLIEEDALYDALAENKIAGAALDVFWDEPVSPDSRWMKLKNLTCTPHMAGGSCDTMLNAVTLVEEQLKDLI